MGECGGCGVCVSCSIESVLFLLGLDLQYLLQSEGQMCVGGGKVAQAQSQIILLWLEGDWRAGGLANKKKIKDNKKFCEIVKRDDQVSGIYICTVASSVMMILSDL